MLLLKGKRYLTLKTDRDDLVSNLYFSMSHDLSFKLNKMYIYRVPHQHPPRETEYLGELNAELPPKIVSYF